MNRAHFTVPNTLLYIHVRTMYMYIHVYMYVHVHASLSERHLGLYSGCAVMVYMYIIIVS